MACPPEDCGGIWGFENFVKAMKKQEGDEYEEYAEWYGDDFDPDEFDMVEINKVSFKDFKKSMDSWSRYDAM